MPKAADIGSKRLISLAPDAWVKWVTQRSNVVSRRIVASEFQWISRDTDVLLEAYDPEIGKFLILNELQLRYSAQMPRRMRAYAALAEERYNLPVYPVLINILQPSSTVAIATAYESEVLGLRALQQYRVINLWEIDAQIVFEQQLKTLLPFIPVLKNGGEEAVVRQAVQLLRTDEQLSELEPLLAFFASFVLSSRLVQQIMRWDMAVLLESPWYQEILNKGLEQGLQQGLEQGLQQGLEQGLQQGLQRGLLSAIELGLEFKFGAEGLELMPQISQIQDVDLLSTISQGLRTSNTLDEVRRIYE